MDEIYLYEWETDEGWLKIESSLDFSAVSVAKKKKHLLKKKRKYYKSHINEDYDPSKLIEPEPKPESESTNDEKAPTQEEEKPKPTKPTPSKPKPTPSSTSASSSSTSQPKKPAAAKPSGNSTQKYLLYSYVLCHLLVVVCSIFVMLGSRRYFSFAIYLTLYCHISWVFFKCGRPQRSPAYMQRVLQNSQSMDAFCAFALWFSPPMIAALAAPVTRSLAYGVSQGQKLLKKKIPFIGNKLDFLLNPIVSRRQELSRMGPLIEVWWGVALVIFWPLGMSGIASIFIYWQFLMMKYIANQSCKNAFSQVKGSLDGYVHKVPFIVPYWDKLCNYLYSQVDTAELQRRAQQGSGGGMLGGLTGMLGGLANKCNIM